VDIFLIFKLARTEQTNLHVGTVGEMPPATFTLDKTYSYGMFVYKQNPGSIQRPFQVINYWIE
jgi:hypothetical protein